MRLAKVISKFINILFVLITGILFVLSLGRHCELDMNTYEQIKSIVPHQIVLYLGVALVFLVVLVCVELVSSQKGVTGSIQTSDLKFHRLLSVICTVLITVISIIWICFNDTVPHSDQAIILEEARKIAGYSSEPYDWSYMSSFNFMRLLVLFMAFLLKVFGDSQMVFRWFNIIMIVMLSIGMQKICNSFSGNKSGDETKTRSKLFGVGHSGTGALISFVLLFFYPVIVYTCYEYGTLAAVTFQVWAFVFADSFIEIVNGKDAEIIDKQIDLNSANSDMDCGNKYRIRMIGSAVGLIFCIFLGIEMHMSALIGMVAICIYLVLRCTKKTWLINFLLIVAMVGFYLIANWGVNKAYVSITDSPHQDAIPISAKVYMGLTAPETQPGGPGSQDGSYWRMFELNDCDAKKTNEYLWPIIGEVVKEYMNGERDMSFFLKKIEYQWLDPSCDAHRIILLNNPENGEGTNSVAYTSFYYSGFRTLALKLATAFMILVYGMSCFAGICELFGIGDNKSLMNRGNDVETNSVNIHFLIQIFVIGGFTFQLIAESISRYVFSYYVLLLVEMVYGVSILADMLGNVFGNWHLKKNLIN